MNWTHSEQPESVFALAALGPNCLAATEQGLWKWHAAQGWQPTAPQFAQVPISAIAASGQTVLIGSADGVALSKDAGETWVLATLPVKAHVLALALSPAFEQDGIAWAATAKDGVLRSPDAGANWHAWNFGLLDMSVNAMAVSPNFAEDETVFIGTELGVFLSENQGRAWRELGFPNTSGPVTTLAIMTEPAKRGASATYTVLAGTEGNGLWISRAPYADWSRVSLKAEVVNALASMADGSLLSGLIAATTDGVFTSTNGKKWTRLTQTDDGVCLTQAGDAVVLGTAGSGVWQTA